MTNDLRQSDLGRALLADMAMAQSRWYCAATKPHQEKRAVSHLERQGYETYCPRFRYNGAEKILFPGYVFVKPTQSTPSIAPIWSTRGVRQVMDGWLYDEEISKLRRRERDGLVELATELACPYREGDPVTWARGLFNGLFAEMVDADRVAVLMVLLGRTVRKILPVSDIQPAVR